MRSILFLLFTLLVSGLSAQSSEPSTNFFGYLNDIRLDSINAHYAEVYFKSEISKQSVDYGNSSIYVSSPKLCFTFQPEDNKKDAFIRDSKGNTVSFRGNMAAALNFLYFNGWDLANIVYEDSSMHSYYFLLKKRI
ncbi:hypothetical protein FC093_19775 [Ilyomonas limi]|uniref:Uncharacterized protein n=1 Tax=Ilyomonas limi TaxID=2575867 RepID=A0A4U3KUT5_9BACT|nr:hypothetical protein [Ilyomonas limi]TKK65559.1 hypothetical protein FC093_19775 [Ilyomonas limi]